MMDKEEIVKQYLELHTLYEGIEDGRIRETLADAELALMEQRYKDAEGLLSTLDNKQVLLERLMTYLRGKPVHKTLKKFMKGELTNKYEVITGLSSLLTHMAIECSRGRVEYLGLIKEMHLRIGRLIHTTEPKGTREDA